MANVFRSKEVYKHLKNNPHDRNEIVPVQGVYVSGEYRPPYYNNPTIKIYTIESQPAEVVDFQDVNESTGDDAIVKVLEFSADFKTLNITNYTISSKSTGDDAIVKVLDFSATFLQPSFDFYKTIFESTGDDAIVKVLEFSATFLQPSFTYYNQQQTNMTPEPMLRLSSLSSEKATIENYT